MKRFLKSDIEYFEKLSKIMDSDIVIESIKRKGLRTTKTGASAMVFMSKKYNYVVKIGDSLDMVPRKSSRFHKYYAKILWRSKNKKIIVQEYVSTRSKDSERALKRIAKECNVDIYDLDETYDIRHHNVGIKNNKPKIIDYRNYSSLKSLEFATDPYWYGRNIQYFR